MKSAYPNLNQPVKLTLFANVPFDNTYKDHSFISSKFVINVEGFNAKQPLSLYAKQENFLYRKNSSGVNVYPQWVLSGEYNFDYSNGLITSLTLELTSEQTNANYLAIQVGDDLGGETYYYFITSIRQSNFNTYTLSLELDVIMTFGDEFLEGMKNVPVMTKRKHCSRGYNGNVYSRYYKNGDSLFDGLKPSIVERVIESKIYINGIDDLSNENLNNVMWLYIVVAPFTNDTYYMGQFNYQCKNINNPFTILCLPVGINQKITSLSLSNSTTTVIINGNIEQFIYDLISDGRFKSCKISPYPPFTSCSSDTTIRIASNGALTITSSDITITTDRVNCYFGNNELTFYKGDLDLKDLKKALVLVKEQDFKHNHDELFYQDFTLSDASITSERIDDPKLLFKPFRKYCISSASGDESEFFPELLTSLSPFTSFDNQAIFLSTINTAYGGDYTTFTFINEVILSNDIVGFKNYKYSKVGLSTTMNYTIPVGENALEVFKSTQSETYYQSKTASAISNGLQIAGGAISTGVGLFSLIGSGGLTTPVSMGLVATGSGMMASGTAGIVNDVKSSNAKIEDLKNTPNSINVSGASYAHDLAMEINSALPYIIVYDVTKITKECANDWFYSYGYEVGKDCYFNYVLPTSDEIEDDNIFTRTIFNYVQLSEDITMKINANIPYIVKQKLSNIFYQGITLWTFFGFKSLYTQQNRVPNESETYNIDKWLYKNKLENKEYKGEAYE